MNDKLSVPLNIPLRWELMRGFGRKELVRTTFVVLVGLAIGLFTNLFILPHVGQGKWVILVFSLVILIAACVSIFTKIETIHQSIYEFLLTARDFRSVQKNYYYVKEEVYPHVCKAESPADR